MLLHVERVSGRVSNRILRPDVQTRVLAWSDGQWPVVGIDSSIESEFEQALCVPLGELGIAITGRSHFNFPWNTYP